MFFDPTKQTIEELYNAPTCRYEIPKYQRPYSWKKENIDEFWDTIIDTTPAFLGTVIYNIENTGFKEIIDGQQRYLTIGIFAAAVRDFLFEEFTAVFPHIYIAKTSRH